MDNIGNWFIWIAYISYIRWGFEALVINEMSGLTFTCNPDENNCWYSGEQVLEFLTWGTSQHLQVYLRDDDTYLFIAENGKIWVCLLVLIGEVVLMRILTYVGLRIHKGT